MRAEPWFVAIVCLGGVGCFSDAYECVRDDQCECPATCLENRCVVPDDPRLCEAPDVDETHDADTFELGPDTHDTDETMVPDTTPTLSPPTNVRASTDRTQDVELTWDAVTGAVGYRVLRCDGRCDDGAWVPLNGAPLTEPRYLDANAAAAAVPFATELDASDDLYAHVMLTWAAVTAPSSPRFRYRVIALGGGEADESAPSAAVEGHRAERPVIGYEVRVGDDGWSLVPGGLVTSWADSGAPAAVLDPGTASASQGAYAEFVRLTVSGAVSSPGGARLSGPRRHGLRSGAGVEPCDGASCGGGAKLSVGALGDVERRGLLVDFRCECDEL